MDLPTPVVAFLWMVATTIAFAAFFAVVRFITVDVHPMQAAFLRYAVSVVLILPAIYSLWRTELRTAPHGLLAFRGLLHSVGVMMWFIAISTISLTDVAALSYLAPVFIIIGAALFLSEPLSFARIIAVAAGLIGAMLIIQPGFSVIEIGQIAMLIAAPIFAASDLITKKLTRTVSSKMILVGLTVWVTVGLAPVAAFYWTTPSLEVILLSVVTAVLATIGHYCFTRAIAVSDISAIQPYRFLSLIWAAILGFFLFSEVPAWTTWLGGALIIGATTMAARRESRRAANGTSREAAKQDNPEGND
ncbi:MAG: DMT family transporter [Alphaproteobacteria bacterium]|nr:DMT family transporter [Alphaproteobacteria bacterium]